MSHKHKTIIPHVPKNGGHSIQEPLCNAGFRKIRLVTGHLRVRDWAIHFKEDPDQWKVVAVIRNPYAWEISFYEDARWRVAQGAKDARYRRISQQTFYEYLRDPSHQWPHYYERQWYHRFYPNPREDYQAYIREMGMQRYWFVKDDNTLPANLQVVRLECVDDELPAALGMTLPKLPVLNRGYYHPIDKYLREPKAKQYVQQRHWWAFTWYDEEIKQPRRKPLSEVIDDDVTATPMEMAVPADWGAVL